MTSLHTFISRLFAVEDHQPDDEREVWSYVLIAARGFLIKTQRWWLMLGVLVGLFFIVIGCWWYSTSILERVDCCLERDEVTTAEMDDEAEGLSDRVKTDIDSTHEADGNAAPQQVVVDVSGGVKHPGMYTLEVGQRVGDAVQAAGGLSDDADRAKVARQMNFSHLIKDEQKIYVSLVGDEAAGALMELPGVPVVAEEDADVALVGLVSINTASIAQLDALPGIGQARATAIIEARPYQSIDELVTRKILSQSIFDGLSGAIQL